MKPIQKHIKLSIYCLFFVFLFPNFSLADELIDASGFSIEPAVSHISVSRDSQFRSGITVKNVGKLPITFRVKTIDFEPENDYGGIKELVSIGDKYDPIKASLWFSLPIEPITVPPNQKFIVPYSITVPEDASPGGRSVAFVVESTGGNVQSRLNAICFLTVTGDVVEDLDIAKFSFSPLLTPKASGKIHIELKNEGKTHVRPEGRIVIRNMFGIERGTFLMSNDLTLGTIIPSAKRSTDYSWNGTLNSFDFGLWNARIELAYGMGGEHSIANRTFFLVLPWRALLLTIIILGGSIYLFVYSIRKLKKDINIMKERGGESNESKLSFKLLIIPFVSGLLLLIVVISTMFSVLENKGEGTLEKIEFSARDTD